MLQKIRRWYNGYSWDGSHFFYNPYSLLSYFDFGVFRNYWFETGTPSFLLEIMKDLQTIEASGIAIGETNSFSYDGSDLQFMPLLFQAGYLTIKAKNNDDICLLDYPNLEVRNAFSFFELKS